MFFEVQEEEVDDIMHGDLEVNLDATPAHRFEYFQTLQEYRVQKLKIALSNQRAVLIKKDFDERS